MIRSDLKKASEVRLLKASGIPLACLIISIPFAFLASITHDNLVIPLILTIHYGPFFGVATAAGGFTIWLAKSAFKLNSAKGYVPVFSVAIVSLYGVWLNVLMAVK